MQNVIVQLSVRDLVEQVLRSGSIESGGIMGSTRMLMGTIAHREVQKSMDGHYDAEVPLSIEMQYEEITFKIDGRADGIIQDLLGVTIDEIKSTTRSLEHIESDTYPLHWAQAKCYAYIYALQNHLPKISVRLTYYQLSTKRLKHFVTLFSIEELRGFFEELIVKYGRQVKWQKDWEHTRNESLQALQFPFEGYRIGQRALAGEVYRTILKGNKCLINAPTGTGKTISTLFPTLKAMGEGSVKKIFYLTAKTITRKVAEDTLQILLTKGTKLKALTLTAKDKCCPLEERQCNSEACEHACGHFDRVDVAIEDALLHTDLFTREEITHYAMKHKVCPFEFALDLSMSVDVIIGDYNYVFDPTAALKRYSDKTGWVILVDEAHNLVDRAREMFSQELSLPQVRHARKSCPTRFKAVGQALRGIETHLKMIRTLSQHTEEYVVKEKPKELRKAVKNFVEETDTMLYEGAGELPSDFVEFYFEAMAFQKIYDLYDERYVTYRTGNGRDTGLKMFCLDPSFLISEALSNAQASIFFSATLLPIQYYQYMLGAAEEKAYYIPSAFDKSKTIRYIARDVSTRYQHREASIIKITDYLHTWTCEKEGNYLAFFPSFTYMRQVYEAYIAAYPEEKVIVQDAKMSEAEREEFLKQFDASGTTLLGFAVVGGIFGEGIDLTGDRLIGTAIVGVGLPQLGLERNLIKYYFDEQEMDGYHYAYTYPGMNRVLQAIGRLIRTEEDYGSILLLDDRYQTSLYQSLMSEQLIPCELVTLQQFKKKLNEGWQHLQQFVDQ